MFSPEQTNRLREDFKRGAHTHTIIAARMKEMGVEDTILKTAILLAQEEYDAIYKDFEGMLVGNNGRYKTDK